LVGIAAGIESDFQLIRHRSKTEEEDFPKGLAKVPNLTGLQAFVMALLPPFLSAFLSGESFKAGHVGHRGLRFQFRQFLA
jgi:hypothetical protein